MERIRNGVTYIHTRENLIFCYPTDIRTVARAYVAYLTFDSLFDNNINNYSIVNGTTIRRWTRRCEGHHHGECRFTRVYLHLTYADLPIQAMQAVRVIVPYTRNNFNPLVLQYPRLTPDILIPDRVALGDDIIITRCYSICGVCSGRKTYTTIAITNAGLQVFHYIIARFVRHVCHNP